MNEPPGLSAPIRFTVETAGSVRDVSVGLYEAPKKQKSGGSIMAQWMIENHKQNPFYTHFDKEEYEAGHAVPSWFDHETDAFGPVVHTLADTLSELISALGHQPLGTLSPRRVDSIAASVRGKASGWTVTSASQKTSTSPLAASAS